MKFVQTKQFRIIPKPAYVVRAIINSNNDISFRKSSGNKGILEIVGEAGVRDSTLITNKATHLFLVCRGSFQFM